MAIRERNGVRVGLHVKDVHGAALGRVTRLHDWGFEFEKGLPILFRQDFVATYDEVRGVKDGVVTLARAPEALFELARGRLPESWRVAAPERGFPTAATPGEASRLAGRRGPRRA